MIPLCLIGNSHLVAIRNGWRDGDPFTAPFKSTFFPAEDTAFSDLVVDGDRLVAGSEGLADQMRKLCGATEIRVRDYSAFVVVALSVQIGHLHNLYSRHRLVEHATPDTHIISRPALRAAIRDQFRKSAAARTVQKIRQIAPSAPIAFIPEPLLSQNVTEHKVLGPFWRGQHVETLANVYKEAVSQMADELDVIGVYQPDETIMAPGFTDKKYSEGVTLWKRNRVRDYDHRHMNAAFGRLMLECALPRLQERVRQNETAG